MTYIQAHKLTFLEMVNSNTPVIDHKGIMIGGPNRKTDDDKVKWSAWQKAVQHACREVGAVPPNVMSYFQDTKHLSSPPKKGDVNIMQNGPIEDALIVTNKPAPLIIHPDALEDLKRLSPVADLSGFVAAQKIPVFKPPRFTWSYTSMQEFLTCPAQWAAKRYYKTIVDVPGEAMRIGNLIHETAEHYLKSKIGQTHNPAKISSTYLPMVQRYCDALIASGAELHVEKEMCFTNKLKPCGWRDWDDVWVRSKGDVLAKKEKRLSIVDWKSGKFKEDFLQLKIFAVFAALTPGFEEIQEFDPKFIFLKETDPQKNILRLPQPLLRSELKDELSRIIQIVRRMEAAWESACFPAKKNGLCRQWCNHTGCPHCGKG